MKKEIIDLTTKRGAVMKAALELISKYGFHGTSTDMIAKQANVGVGTIYRYFASKDLLINELYLDIKTYFSEALLEHDHEAFELQERIKRIWINLLKVYIAHPEELRFVEQYANSPFLSLETRGQQEELSTTFKNLFEEGKKQALFRDLPNDILRAILYGAALQLAKMHMSNTIKLTEELIAASFESCWNAVKKQD